MTETSESTESEISVKNDHFVGSNGDSVGMVLPPVGPIPSEQAIRLAAWLVICAGDYDAKRFAEVFRAVSST